MNLVVDIGNTRTKAALFDANNIVEYKVFGHPDDLLSELHFIKKANHAIIASVVENTNEFFEKLNNLVPTYLFTSASKTPLTNLYQTSSTLGSDRIAASVGAYSFYPNHHVLTIDAGTCIKYNFTNNKNEFLGGGISPGMQIRFKALHHFTGKLPLVNSVDFAPNIIGSNTTNSILSGVVNGCVKEIDGIINDYKAQYPEILVLLTGGDCEYFAKQLKSSIFTHPNLLLIGLNAILNINLGFK